MLCRYCVHTKQYLEQNTERYFRRVNCLGNEVANRASSEMLSGKWELKCSSIKSDTTLLPLPSNFLDSYVGTLKIVLKRKLLASFFSFLWTGNWRQGRASVDKFRVSAPPGFGCHHSSLRQTPLNTDAKLILLSSIAVRQRVCFCALKEFFPMRWSRQVLEPWELLLGCWVVCPVYFSTKLWLHEFASGWNPSSIIAQFSYAFLLLH